MHSLDFVGIVSERYVNPRALRRLWGLFLHSSEPCFLRKLPAIGQPGGQIAHARRRQVDEQLREIDLRVDVVAAAGRSQTGEDGRGPAAARVAHEETVFSDSGRSASSRVRSHYADRLIMPHPAAGKDDFTENPLWSMVLLSA